MAGARYYLIAAGTAVYDHLPSDLHLPSVVDDLRLVAGSFSSRGYERVLPELGESPTAAELQHELGSWLTAKEREAGDVLVFYYSGHGESVADDAHYLVTRDTEFDGERPFPHTAVADDQLARLFASSRLQQALVVLDTCYSGHGIADFSAKAGAMLRKRSWAPSAPYGIHLVAAARPRERAAEHAFARAFTRAIANAGSALGGSRQEFLDPRAVVEEVNKLLEGNKLRQRAVWMPATATPGNLPWLIKNPGFGASPAPATDPSGSSAGRPAFAGAAAGRYFTGRVRVLDELTGWLTRSPGDGKARVVTGGAGTGKSAVLARLVELLAARGAGGADSVGPDLAPEILAVDARQRSLDQLIDWLAAELGESAKRPEDLLSALARRSRPTAIVIDAVDESSEPARIVRDLLRPLASRDAVRLVVGIRPEAPREDGRRRVPSLGAAVVELDLDDPALLGPHDVEEYVTHRLLASEEGEAATPYRGRRALAQDVARAVASQAGGVFLVARLVSETLAAAEEPVDTTRRGWEKSFAQEIGQAFDAFLERVGSDVRSGLDKRTVVDLLRPLAFARGEGLPRERVWEALAGALAGREYLDEDVSSVLRLLASYVVEATERDRSVYRLGHEALAEWLRAPCDEPDIQSRIVDALLRLSPAGEGGSGRDWPRADPYALTYLASHAAAAGRLDELAADPLFLAMAEPATLVPVLSQARSEEGREGARLYRLAVHRLGAGAPEVRLAQLELAAHQHGGERLLARAGALRRERPFSVAWARWAPAATHRVLEARGSFESLTVGRFEGRPVVIAPGLFTVRGYHLDDGAPAFRVESLRHHYTSAAIVTAHRTPVVLALTAVTPKPSCSAWRLADGGVTAGWDARHLDVALGLAADDRGENVLVAIGGKGSGPSYSGRGIVEIWELEAEGPRFRRAIAAHDGAVTSLAATSSPGRRAVVSGGKDGWIRVWDLVDGSLLAAVEVEPPPNVVAAAVFDGTLTLAVGSDELIRVFQERDGELRLAFEPQWGHADGVIDVHLSEIGGSRVCASTGSDNVLRLWRFGEAKPVYEELLGFAGVKPVAIVAAEVYGEPVLVAADSGGAIRLFYCRTEARPHGDRYGGYTLDVAPFRSGDALRLVTRVRRDELRELLLWDGEEGSPLSWPGEPLTGRFLACSVGELDGRPILVALGEGGLEAWSLDDGSRYGKTISSGLAGIRGLRCCSWGNRLLTLAHCWSGLRLFDIGAGLELAAWGDVETGILPSGAALASTSRGPVVVTCGEGPSLFLAFSVRGDQASIESQDLGFGLRAVAVCPGGPEQGRRSFAAGVRRDGGLSIVDLESGSISTHSGDLYTVDHVACAHADGEPLVVTGTDNGSLSLWRGGRLFARIETDCQLNALALTAERVVIGASEGLLMLRLPERP